MWSRRRRRTSLAVVLTALVALALVGPSSALAQAAQVEKIAQCSEQEGGAVFCTKSMSVSQGVVTPSGKASILQHVRFDNSFTAPGCVTRDLGSSRNHLLIDDDGQNQEFHFAFQIHSTFDCLGTSTDCTTRLHFHFANGAIQFTREETFCQARAPSDA
jgi:hypothetical protein